MFLKHLTILQTTSRNLFVIVILSTRVYFVSKRERQHFRPFVLYSMNISCISCSWPFFVVSELFCSQKGLMERSCKRSRTSSQDAVTPRDSKKRSRSCEKYAKNCILKTVFPCSLSTLHNTDRHWLDIRPKAW